MTQGWLTGACLGMSAALHVWLAAGVARPEGRAPARREPILVALAPEPPPPPVVTPPEPPPPEPKPRPLPKAPSVPAPEPVALEPSVTEPEPPVPELTGTTLVAAQGAGWSAPSGSGAARDLPIRAGLARSQVAPVVRVRAAPPAATEIPLARLSKPPVPPSLEDALRRNYPAAARIRGESGDAKLRARIEPSGHVRVANVTSESVAGFGEACRRTLLSSRWTAPLDSSGRAVATWVTYRCKFRIDH